MRSDSIISIRRFTQVSNIADFIAIVTAILTIAFFIYPETRGWLEQRVRIFRSPGCVAAIVSGSLFFLAIMAIPPTIENAREYFATPTPTPTLTPIPSPTATLPPTPAHVFLFSDDFDTGVASDWSQTSGVWQMVNNEYSMTNVGDRWTYGQSFAGDATWTDYRLGVQIRMETSLSIVDNQAEIIVRAQDASNYLVLIINNIALFNMESSKGLWYIVKNSQATPLSNTSFTVEAYTDTFYAEVEVQGDIITTLINGKEVSRWSGAPYLNGKVGLAINSMNPSHPPSFDKFSVRLISP